MRFEVQTRFTYGWENCWSIEDDKLEYFETRQEAEDAILEFFADLGRSGIRQLYSLDDYRVVLIDNGAVNT